MNSLIIVGRLITLLGLLYASVVRPLIVGGMFWVADRRKFWLALSQWMRVAVFWYCSFMIMWQF